MMRVGSKRAIASALAVAGVSLIGVAVAAQGGDAQPRRGGTAQAASGPPLAEQAFKNVQAPALRTISVDDFMLTMGIMTSSLGFDCADCHAGAGTDRVDWAADTPRKRTARR